MIKTFSSLKTENGGVDFSPSIPIVSELVERNGGGFYLQTYWISPLQMLGRCL